MSAFSRSVCRALPLLLILSGPAALSAEPPKMDRHMGVASCAGSTCHGATQAFAGHQIRQDEYFTWQRQDRHARAYNALLSERSRKISARLGWGDPAKAEGCLSCHTDFVPEQARGGRFLLSDGVGCEACHGGSERWLSSHVQGFKSSQERVASGLYPAWEPAARAAVCLGCHQGGTKQEMTHAIMAAGHPPLLFELDTFTMLQPAHFQAGGDYAARKGAMDPALNWLMGQIASAELFLEQLATARRGGVFPELALFDCNACHHSMFAGRASAARTAARQPGTVPLADTALLLLRHWLAVSDAALGERWDAQWRRLYQAVDSGDVSHLRAQALDMRKLLREQLLPRAKTQALSGVQLRQLLAVLLDESAQSFGGDFSHAEQTAMGASVLLTALQQREAITINAGMQAAVDAIYTAVKDRDHFNVQAYRTALQQLRSEVLHSAGS